MKKEADNESVSSITWFTPRGLAPMFKLPLCHWIGNAAAVLLGSHGDVTQAAQQAGCSRQTVYDHADKVQQSLEDAQLPGPSREELLTQLEYLRSENAHPRRH